MPNSLINEKSPYLLQHANNPVNWHPWNEEALAEAKNSDKPIFLSIGYSTCYWCHVMERESFEDEGIAELLNASFINIKVDREERPDLDRIYMSALQSITGSGGWPMSIFLTPDLKPFYAATYIPPKSKYGRAGFEDIIQQIDALWKTRKADVINSSEKILELLKTKNDYGSSDADLYSDGIYHDAFRISADYYDEENGGFGSGNKFPRPAILRFLLDYYHHFGDARALDMVSFTLKKMNDGGIFDNIDGGFHRYAVDPKWRVPHFEKMLYDQAQLIHLLSDTYRITKDKMFLAAAKETLDYSARFLLGSEGGFYSAEDAESAHDESMPHEKTEGYFYMWEKSDIDAILGKEHADVFNYRFGVYHKGNTLSDPHGIFGTKNVLFKSSDIHDTAAKFGITPEEAENIISESLIKLKKERDKRPRPFLDRKILTGWNGMMITALSDAYRLTGEPLYLAQAENAAEFVLGKMSDGGGRLYRRYIGGEKKFDGTLEDYAFFIQGLINLYYAGFRLGHLESAIMLTDRTLAEFYDRDAGGFFDSAEGKSDLIMRTKETYDGAEPSGNAVMLENLIQLSVLAQRADYREAAEKSLGYFFDTISRQPFSSPYYLHSLISCAKSPAEIFITGKDNNGKLFSELLGIISSKFLPSKIIALIDEEFMNKFNYIKDIIKNAKETKVYVCENFKCSLPAGDSETLKKILNKE